MTQPVRLLIVWIAAILVVGPVGLLTKDGDEAAQGGTTTASDGQSVSTLPGEGGTTVPGGSTPGSSDGGAATTAPGPSVSAPPAVDAPPPGSYATAVSGEMTFNGTETFPAPPDGEILVEVVESGDQRVSIPIGPGLLSSILRYKPDGIDLVSADLVLGPAKTFEPAQPVVHVPGVPQPGQSWNWLMASTDGATNGTFTTTASGPAVVDVGGQQIPVVVLETDIVFDARSDLNGLIHITTWFSVERKMPMQNRIILDVNYGGGVITLTSDVTQTLTSLSPS